MIHTELKLDNISIFEKCPFEILKEFQKKSHLVTFKPRTVVAQAQDLAHFVYVVLFGNLKILSPEPSNKEVVYHFLSRGETFGASLNFIEKQTYESHLVAIDNCGTLKIPSEIFHQYLLSHPPALRTLWQQTQNQITDLQRDRSLYKLSTPIRLAELLVRLLERQPPIYGNRIMIRLSRKDLAGKIGAESETVVRIISDWTKNGWIRTEDHCLELLNPQAIKQLIQN